MSFGPFAVGLGKGYTSPALASLLPNSNNQTDKRIPSFSPHLPNLTITEQQGSWIASLSLLGEKNFEKVGGVLAVYIGVTLSTVYHKTYVDQTLFQTIVVYDRTRDE